MKNFTLCLSLFFLMAYQVNAQVAIGNGTSTNKHVPFEAHSPYSYAQSIYLASEIGTSGSITAVRWYFSGATSDDWNMQGLDYSQDIKIYIGHTNKSEFASNEDWILGSNLELTYEGAIPVENTGWVTVNLDIPFTYNGTDNLVIAVKESMDGADPADADFWAFQVEGNRSISSYGYDLQNVDEPPYADYLGNFVPNIVFEGIIQPCPHPVNIEISEVGTTTLSMNWDPFTVFSSAGTEYYISESDENPTAATPATGSVGTGISTVTVTTGLNPGTQYYVWLRDVCEDGPGNWSAPIAFATNCLPANLINEDFDDSLSLPICWSTLLRGSGLTPDAMIEVVDWESNSGTNSVHFYNDSSSPTADLFLVSPPIGNLAAGTHRLKFFSTSVNEGVGVLVGTLDSNAPDAVFSELDNITVNSNGNFSEYTVDFTINNEPGAHLAIKMNPNTSYVSIYVDDIRWEVAPACPDVSLIEFPLTTATTATVSWTPTGAETEWEIVSATADVTSPEGLTPVTATVSPTGLIQNLLENTSYNVWVRSICDAGEGAWIGPVAFTTTCLPVNNLNESFETAEAPQLASCWTKILRGQTVGEDGYIRTVDFNANSGTNAVAINNGFSNMLSDDIILVSPNLGNLEDGTHRLKFFAKNEGNGGLQIGTLTSNTNAAVFTPFAEVETTGTYAEYKIDFSDFVDNDAPTDSYIGIRMATISEFSTVYIDDVKWEVLPLCPDPTDLSASTVGINTATVQWAPGDAETQWQIVYGEATVLSPSDLTPSEILTSTTKNLTDLEDNTSYKLWVRSVCTSPEANGDWIGPLMFTTKCIPTNYFSENFNSVTAPELPGCWSSILRGELLPSSAYIRTTTSQSNSAPNTVRINNSGASSENDLILVSPVLANLSGSNQIKFHARRLGLIDIEVGTLNNNSNNAVFTPLQTVVLTSTYSQQTVTINYEGTDTYLGFRILSDGSYGSVLIDDIIWESVSMCTDVNTLSISEITLNSADIAWQGVSGDVQVAYGLASVSNPNTLTPSELIDDSFWQLSNLQSNTAYRFWVRSVCEQGFGAWVGPIEFSTKCSFTEVPFTEDFEGLLVPALPNCSSIENLGEANNWLSNYPIDYEGTALTYGGSDAVANAWYFTQGINLIQGQQYSISYDFGNRGFETSESFKVMYGTDDAAASMTLPLADHPVVSGVGIESNEVLFTAPTSAVYYFGFNAYSGSGQNILFVDNISIDSTLSNGDFSSNSFSFYPNPVKDFLNLSYTENISMVEVYTILGQLIDRTIVNAKTTKVSMANLPQGNYIVKVVADGYIKTIKVIKK